MGSGIYKSTSKGRVELSNKEVRAFIMKTNKWSQRTYEKEYDKFRNKLRAFESYEKAKGVDVKKQSPMQVLYKEAKAKQREGKSYKPSIQMSRIKKFTSVSSGKAGQKALASKSYLEKRDEEYRRATNKAFAGFIKNNAKAREIANTIKDPVKREQALKDYANKVHAKVDESGKRQVTEAVQYGEVAGSDDPIDFDMSEYF